MAEEKIDLTKGGIAIVMVGNTGFVKEFANDARVRFIDCKQTPGEQLDNLMPQNTKLIIITDGLPQYHSTWAFTYAKRRNILYLIRKSNQAIYETLKQAFNMNGNGETKPTIEEIKDAQVKGKLSILIPSIDFSKSNSENARMLVKKAIEFGIRTTENSLAQLVSIQRRKGNYGGVPRSVRSKLDVSVDMLDVMVKDLQEMRDFLIETTEENRLLRQKVDKFKKALDE